MTEEVQTRIVELVCREIDWNRTEAPSQPFVCVYLLHDYPDVVEVVRARLGALYGDPHVRWLDAMMEAITEHRSG